MEAETSGNREVILREALTLFALRGYEAVGVQEICESAGITKPTLYHWFGSKNGILNAIVADIGSPYYARITEAASYQRDLTINLLNLMRTAMEQAIREPHFVRLYLALSAAAPDNEGHRAFSALAEALYGRIDELFCACLPEMGNIRGHEALCAQTFLGLMDNRSLAVINGQFQPTDAGIRRVIHQFMHGIL